MISRPPTAATIAGAHPSFWPAPDLAVDGAFVAAGVCADSDAPASDQSPV
jgi:hypothetical protein